ncbi:hypothetical protein EV201_0643 [Ancylomarina subtilis]|uniref:Uncharacterized protein n=1 Tax=Ancylomarina subtilis TaxID=1639035 RepID=A0A4Q7VIX1_9BACT|nr:hypothetical protein [Ancylomarina subtilis]RZT96014.1 hypothetical protein EV201_0643 [Ancylomarina subtilis]
MNNKLELYHSILFLNKRPYRTRSISQNKYRELLKGIEKVNFNYQPAYELRFLKPHTDKSKYYRDLIKNEAIKYFNHVNELVSNANDGDVKAMWVHTTLSNILVDKLNQIAGEIERLNYPISNIDPKQAHKLKDTTLCEETYIYQYLKLHLIVLYLNLQVQFEEYLKVEKLDEEDIYLKYFQESVPEPSFIKPSKKIETPIVKKKPKEEFSFEPIRRDIQPIGYSLIDYDMILNKDAFAQVECNLYDFGIIDIESCFIKNRKQSNNTLLAAIYKVLIENNYFRRNILGEKKRCTDIDFRKYLDARYRVDTTQQFRRITEEQINDAKVKLPWLDKIYPIR